MVHLHELRLVDQALMKTLLFLTPVLKSQSLNVCMKPCIKPSRLYLRYCYLDSSPAEHAAPNLQVGNGCMRTAVLLHPECLLAGPLGLVAGPLCLVVNPVISSSVKGPVLVLLHFPQHILRPLLHLRPHFNADLQCACPSRTRNPHMACARNGTLALSGGTILTPWGTIPSPFPQRNLSSQPVRGKRAGTECTAIPYHRLSHDGTEMEAHVALLHHPKPDIASPANSPPLPPALPPPPHPPGIPLSKARHPQ